MDEGKLEQSLEAWVGDEAGWTEGSGASCRDHRYSHTVRKD